MVMTIMEATESNVLDRDAAEQEPPRLPPLEWRCRAPHPTYPERRCDALLAKLTAVAGTVTVKCWRCGQYQTVHLPDRV